MRTDVHAAARGPETLFAEIAEPRLAYVVQSLNTAPMRTSLAFGAIVAAFTTLLALSQAHAPGNGALIDLLPSETAFALMLGLAVFPLRLITVPLLTYLVCFSLGFGLRLWLEDDYLPAGIPPYTIFWTALVLNALPAIAAAIIGRAVARRAGQGALGDVLLSLASTVAYIVIAGALVAGMVTFVYPPDLPDESLGLLGILGAGFIRVIRIGLCGAVLVLYLLDRPDRRNMGVALLVLPLFIGLAVLRNLGVAGHPPLDVELLALAVALLAPPYAAIFANIVGVSAYVMLTGEFLVQHPVPSADVMKLELASVFLLALDYLLLLQRHIAQAELERNRATIDRMIRIRALATIGYFVMDTRTGRVRLDAVAAEILGTPASFTIADFIGRVRPEDRPIIEASIADISEESRTLSFLFSSNGMWSETAETRYVTVHAWYEDRSGSRSLAYGALIDLTRDHRREQDLAAALASLSEQQNRQTQMFSIVSHELRTPASVISMLLEELEGGASWQEMGPRLRAVSDQLLSVLADMRQTVRPEQNLPIRLETLRPQEVAETVRNTFALMAGARQIDLDLDLAPEAWQLRVSDRVRLVQALSNLVKNAILHAECRRITIGYSETAVGAGVMGQWRVSDDGRGVPPEAQATLFDAFRRGAGTSTTRTDGSGLGLYVTKSSVELLSGTVTYQPRAAGGSVFVMRLPMALPAESEEKGAPRQRVDLASLKAMTVLIAEDSDLIGELLVARLRRVFGRIVWVRDGQEALVAFDAEAPDMVLTDLFMPQMGGDDLTAALREKGAECPIIGMTAAAIGDERERFEAAGTDRVLTKPISTAQLIEVLEGLAGNGRSRPAAE